MGAYRRKAISMHSSHIQFITDIKSPHRCSPLKASCTIHPKKYSKTQNETRRRDKVRWREGKRFGMGEMKSPRRKRVKCNNTRSHHEPQPKMKEEPGIVMHATPSIQNSHANARTCSSGPRTHPKKIAIQNRPEKKES